MELILVRSMTYFTLPKRDAVLYYLPVTVQGAFSPPHIRSADAAQPQGINDQFSAGPGFRKSAPTEVCQSERR